MRFASRDDSGGGLGLVALLVFKSDFGVLANSTTVFGESSIPLFFQTKITSREFDRLQLLSRDFDQR
jgi:hypothetical protein